MNDFERLNANLQQQIDAACDRYEAGLLQGEPPAIKQLLDEVDDDIARRILFAELLAIDLEQSGDNSCSSRMQALKAEFPDYASTLDRAIKRDSSISQRNNASLETVTGSDTTPSVHAYDDLEVRHLAHYELVERVGTGAFGQVWKAHDTKLNRTVAIKLPRTENLSESDSQRFLKEAQLSAQLKHPNIVSVHEISQSDRTPYIASDFIEGVSIEQWRQQQDRSFADVTRLCIQIADALHHAHEAGIVHRDLKPTNVLVDANNNPHVADFGLAKSLADETMTMEGNLLGSPAYMSPEQAKGDAVKADRCSDIYSLGVILYELIVGERPFRGNLDSVIHQVIYSEPAAPRTISQRVPRDLETICLKCLNKDISKRYQSSQLLADDLRRFESGEPIHARPVSASERVWSWCKRNPAFATAIGLASALLLLFAIAGPRLAVREARRAEANREVAERREEERKIARREASVRGIASIETALRFNGPKAAQPILDDMLKNGDPDVLAGFPFRHLQYVAKNTGRRSHVTSLPKVIVDPNSELIVLGENGKELILWDTSKEQEFRRLPYHGVAAFSPDGKLLAIVELAKDGKLPTIQIVAVQTGRRIASHPIHWYGPEVPQDIRMENSFISALSWSYDQKWLSFSTWWNRHIRLVNLESGEMTIFAGGDNHGEERLPTIAFSPTSDQLASGGFDGKLRLWSIADSKMVAEIPGDTKFAFGIDYSRDGTKVCFADETSVHVVDTETFDKRISLGIRNAEMVAFAPDGHSVASGHENNITITRLDDLTERETLRTQTTRLMGLGFTASGRLLSSDFMFREDQKTKNVIDWGNANERGNTLLRYPVRYPRMAAAISPDCRLVANERTEGTVLITDVKTQQSVDEFSLPDGRLPDLYRVHVEFNPHAGSVELATLTEKNVVLWSGKGKPLEVLAPDTESDYKLTSLSYSPDGSLLYAADETGRLWIWNRTSNETTTWPIADVAVKKVAVSPKGDRIAIVTADAHRVDEGSAPDSTWKLLCYATEDRSLIFARRLNNAELTDLDWHPDGTMIATSAWDGATRLWQPETGEPIATLNPHSEQVRAGTFTADGRYFVTASTQVKFWDLATFEPVMALDAPYVIFLDVECSRDGQFVVTASRDGSVRVWQAVPPSETK